MPGFWKLATRTGHEGFFWGVSVDSEVLCGAFPAKVRCFLLSLFLFLCVCVCFVVFLRGFEGLDVGVLS